MNPGRLPSKARRRSVSNVLKAAQRFHGAEFVPLALRVNIVRGVAQIAAMLPPGQSLILFTAIKPEIPSGYAVTLDANGRQMIAEKISAVFRRPSCPPWTRRRFGYFAAWSRLLDRVLFNSRTNELGNFFGIREKGDLWPWRRAHGRGQARGGQAPYVRIRIGVARGWDDCWWSM